MKKYGCLERKSKNSEARLNFIKNYYRVPIFNIGQHNPKVDKTGIRLYANF